PVGGREIIRRVSREKSAVAEPKNGFSALPHHHRSKGVPGCCVHRSAVRGEARGSPNSSAPPGAPKSHPGRLSAGRYGHYPTVVGAAISKLAPVRDVEVAVQQKKRAALARGGSNFAEHVHVAPPVNDGTIVERQRVVLLPIAVDRAIPDRVRGDVNGSRVEVDDWRSSHAFVGSDVSAGKLSPVCRGIEIGP